MDKKDIEQDLGLFSSSFSQRSMGSCGAQAIAWHRPTSQFKEKQVSPVPLTAHRVMSDIPPSYSELTHTAVCMRCAKLEIYFQFLSRKKKEMPHEVPRDDPTMRSVSSLSTVFGPVADSEFIRFLTSENIAPLNTAATKHNIY